jgi:hypothetical protein
MRNRFAGLALAAATGLLACAAEHEADAGPPPSPAEAEVIAAVDALFTAMYERDSTALRSLLLPNAWLVAVDETGTRPSDVESFIARVSGRDEGFLERMWDPEVRIDGPIATLWTLYDFHRGGEFSHCGTDAAQLAFVDGEWRIQSIIYTIEREGCPESPLGPPSTGG